MQLLLTVPDRAGVPTTVGVLLLSGKWLHIPKGQSYFVSDKEVSLHYLHDLVMRGFLNMRETAVPDKVEPSKATPKWQKEKWDARKPRILKCPPLPDDALHDLPGVNEQPSAAHLRVEDEVSVEKPDAPVSEKEFRKMTRKRTNLQVLAATLFISALACLGIRIHHSMDFGTQYEEYMRAAMKEENADKSVKKAQHAVAYLDSKGLTTGRTAVLYESPETDVSDWYTVVSEAVEQYGKTKDRAKFKKAIYGNEDADPDKDRLPTPPGISIHPNNPLYSLWGWGSFVLSAVCLGCSFLTKNGVKPVDAAKEPNVVTGSQPTHYIIGNMTHVIYRTVDGHIHDLWWNGRWNDTDITAQAGCSVIAAGDPVVSVVGNMQRIVFRGTDNCMHELSYDYTAHSKWQYANLTRAANAPLALA